MPRGKRDSVAAAAGHDDGSWVSNWLAGRQKHATIDELAAMLRVLHVDLGRVLTLQTTGIADEDWEIFGGLGRIQEAARPTAIQLILAVIEKYAEPQSVQQQTPRPNRRVRTERGKQ